MGTRRLASVMLAVGAVVVALVVVIASFASRGVPRGDERLYGTTWALESAMLDGSPVDVTAPGQRVRWELRFYKTDSDPNFSDTPVILITDGCGRSTQELDLDDASGRWTWNGWGYSGSRSCAGGFTEVMQAFFEAETFDYAIDDRRLSLESADGNAQLALRS